MLYSKNTEQIKETQPTITSNGIKKYSFDEELLSTPLDKVFLFTFPQAHHVHNISPFSLKVESFLRLHKIPYEVVSTFKFSPKGQIPYIRLNSKEDGVLIADSNFIIEFLSKKLGIDKLEEGMLSSHERAIAHAYTRMVEEHTTQIGFYYRYALNMPQFCSAVLPQDWFTNNGPWTFKRWFVSKMFPIMMPMGFKKKMKWVSFGRHSDEEKWTISCQDIQSISDFLGEKEYMFGKEATTLDCTLFGHLAQFLFIPLDFPQKKFMKEHCGNVVEYVERFKEMYWKDWDAV